MTQRVLEKQHIYLDELQEPDRTYITILETFPGIGIDDFNQLLIRRDLKTLGSKEYGKSK